MGIIKRQFFKASAATYVGVVLGYINVTILFPYFCSPEELGLYRVIINLATMFAAFAYMGAPQAIIKQYPFFKQKDQVNEFFGLIVTMFLSTVVFSIIVLFLLKSPVVEFFSEKSPEVGEYYNYAIFIAIALVIYVLFMSNARILKRIAFPAFLKDVFLRVLIMGGLLLIGIELINFKNFLFLLCILYFLIALIAIIYSLRLFPFKISFNLKILSRRDIKDTLYFSFLTFLSGITGIIILNADSIMITGLSENGLTDTGIYTIAFFIGSTLEIPRRMIILVTGPLIAEYWVEGRMNDINRTYTRTSATGLIIGLVIFAVIWINLKTIYNLIPNSDIYIGGLNIVLLILIARLIEMVCSVAPNIISQTRLYAYNLPLSAILVILTIGLNYLLIPPYGILGAGIATMISIAVYNLLKVLLVWQVFRIQPFSWKILSLTAIFALMIIFNSQIPDFKPIIFSLIIRNLLFLFVFGFIVYKLNITPDLKRTAFRIIIRFRKKWKKK